MALRRRKADSGAAPEEKGGIRRIFAAYKMTREQDRWVGLVCLAWAIPPALVVGFLVGFFIYWLAGVILAIPTGVVVWLFVFGRRAERAAYAQVEGRPGAAGAALGLLRRGWQVQHAVAVTKSQDLVHRVVGRPGVVLVGEGNPSRVRNLLAVEKRKHARVVGEVPIYDIVVGNGEDDTVPVTKLARHVSKLPRNIAPADVTDVLQRLKALDAMRPQIPMPKGPMPTSARQARQQARQSMRGR